MAKMNSVLAALALIVAAAFPALAASTLPGGATSLNEAHGDWTLGCAMQGQDGAAALHCAASQRQANATTHQQVLAIELTPAGDAAKGMLALPLGMALAKGVVMQVDAGSSTSPEPYATCVTAGCLVPLNFDAANLKLLRGGKALNVYAASADGKPVKFAVSLNGLPEALDRAIALLAGK